MNAYDDLPQTSPEMQALAVAPGANAYDDIEPPPPRQKAADKPYTLTDQLIRGAGLSVNALAHGAGGLLNMVPDAMHSLSTLTQNPHIPSWQEINPFAPKPADMPSAQTDLLLDQVFPTPQTPAEKVASFGLSLEGAAAVPLPSAAALVKGAGAIPSNFVNPATMQAQRLAAGLQKAQESGYVVPPSTTNPTWLNKTLETVGGKEATQNQARVINQQARNAGAAADIGLKPEVFTPDAVAAVKQEAGQGFEGARQIPSINTGQSYNDALDAVVKESHGANASFPGAANPDVQKLVDIYRQPEFTGDAAVSATKMLRAKASDAYRQGNSEMGMAYKGISNAIENELQRGAQTLGQPDLVAALRQARKTYAQASTIEDVSDPQGNVSGQKLAAAWRRDEPLSGNLLTAAEHAANYPKANLPANSSNISHLNMYGAPAISLAMEHATGSPFGLAAGAALPVTRAAARKFLLSDTGQSLAKPGTGSKYADALARLVPGGVVGGSNSP